MVAKKELEKLQTGTVLYIKKGANAGGTVTLIERIGEYLRIDFKGSELTLHHNRFMCRKPKFSGYWTKRRN